MKKIIIKFSLLSLLVSVSFSCSKKIDEAYANPNAPVRVPVEQLLPQIIQAMAANYAGHGTMNDARYVGAYIQNWQYYSTGSVYDQMGYTNSSGDVSQSTWRMHYYDIGQNNMRMIQWATEEKKWDYAGVGKAIFAWSWLTIVDYYGEVILKEAFNTELITFHYDQPQEVYDYVRQLCFESLDNLNKTGDGVSQANLALGDAYMYNGDVNKWKKFVYGILARYYNHQSNKPNYKPDSVIYYANLAINSNADNAMVKFQQSNISATKNFYGPYRGNLGASTVSPTAIRQGAYIANLMNGTNTAFSGVNDPRAWYMLRGNANGTIVGVQPNKGQTVLATNDRPQNFWGMPQISASNAAPGIDTSRYIFMDYAPFPIMTASEIKFMKAEAAFKKGDKATALTAYREGIDLDFDLLTGTYSTNVQPSKVITPAVKAAFLADTRVVPTDPNLLTLNKIMLQKYIAMFGYGVLETWVDMRRYHYIDPDPSGTGQVYTDFTPPSGGDLYPDNAASPFGPYVYRVRPRFNSEYVWNINELNRIGATSPYYHTKKIWIAE
ncbi:MAG: SusD/RagB family nutrient-binding outer membrane lipoprotein [Chitinophagaceae bacterium]